ncbi:DUF4129 domain-containing protein [Halogranum gelatinilyticum]|uniref:DUF4129 domain-containing protein n=1 Tax=Halogranum gelatinilyticum TaxID=660521 RepID=UPI00147DAB8A|nr:DUF4129 domain-containing protein [Halogranum gelatinilyticum]
MAYDPARAALALLCVLVVAFAASLFPATGFGTYPTSADGGGGLTDAPLDGASTPSDPAQFTSTPTATPEPTSDEATATPTPEPTTDESTPAAGSQVRTDGLGDFLVAVLLAGTVLVVGGVGFLLVPLGNELTVAGVELPALQARLRGVVGAVPRRTMTFVVGLSASVPGLLDSLGSLTTEVASSLGVVAAGAGRAALGSVRLFTAGFAAAFVSLPRALGGGLFSMAGSLSRVGGSFGRGPRGDGDTDEGTAGRDTPSPEPGDDAPPSTVQEVWAAMVEVVPVPNRRSATPRDYARAAIDAGFPSTAVEQLTTTFEEVRYGGRPSTADRLRAARAALRRILDGGDGE